MIQNSILNLIKNKFQKKIKLKKGNVEICVIKNGVEEKLNNNINIIWFF